MDCPPCDELGVVAGEKIVTKHQFFVLEFSDLGENGNKNPSFLGVIEVKEVIKLAYSDLVPKIELLHP